MTGERRRKVVISACWLISAALLPGGCNTQRDPVSRETTAMDTYLSVTIYDSDAEKGFLNAMIDSAFLEIRRIELVATDYSDSSEIGRVNLSAGKDTVAVSYEIRTLLGIAARYSALSGSSFDVTVGPVVRLWDFMALNPRVPDSLEVRSAVSLVDYRRVEVSDRGVFLSKKGMRLDLGGIAKGYAVDRALEVLRREGIRNVIVDLGGNLGIYWAGTSLLDSTRATVSIRHPRLAGRMFGHVSVGTCGIATSGDYQRFFVKDGIRYHHLLDPHTGYPVHNVVSVTVIARTATIADALSTTVFVLGRVKGMELIESLQGVDGIIITEEDGRLSYEVSSGLKGRFVPEDSRD